MTTWLCRIMAAVFTLNILAPTELLAQRQPSSPAGTQTLSFQALPKSNEELRAQVEAKFKDSIEAAQQQYENAKGAQELYAAIKQLHAVMNQHAAEKAANVFPSSDLCGADFQPACSTRVAPKILPQVLKEQFPKYEDFEAKVKKGNMPLSDLISYLDPLENGNWMYTVFAAEILGNSADSLAADTAETIAPDLSDWLLEVQLRAIYRLQSAPKGNKGVSQLMAEGTLRLLLLKLNNFFKRAGIPNPLFERKTSVYVTGSQKVKKERDWTKGVWVASDSDQSRWTFRPAVTYRGVLPEVQVTADPAEFSEHMYRKMMDDFLAELRAYKAEDLKESDAHYHLLLLAVQYAVAYAMDYDPSQVTAIVGYFDPGPAETDFKQQYSAVLNSLLTSLLESVRYSPGEPKYQQANRMLLDFSDPKKYSVPTRISALEMASLLYRPQDPAELLAKNARPSSDDDVISSMANVNIFLPDERLRPVFARRVVDLYTPLNNTHPVGVKDYGLDSSQMAMLADKLAYIYNGFANEELQWDTSRQHNKKSYVLDLAEDGRSLILNAANSVPRLHVLGQGYQFQLPDGSLREVSGFGRNSQGVWKEMNLRNGLNFKKRYDEIMQNVMLFIGEALLWAVGGEIIGVAWRVTRGAMISLPKAVRAAAVARNGRRTLSFSVEMQKGIRYSNLASTTRLNGISITASRTEEVRKPLSKIVEETAIPAKMRLAPSPVTAVHPGSSEVFQQGWWSKRWARLRSAWSRKPQVVEGGVPMLPSPEMVSSKHHWWDKFHSWWKGEPYVWEQKSVVSRVASMRDFRNSRGWWRGNRAAVDEWTVSVQRPGFGIELATLSGPRAARLQNGIQNWDDWRYFIHAARTAEGGFLKFTAPLTPWRSLWQGFWKPMFGMTTPAGNVLKEQRIVGATSTAFAEDAAKKAGEGVFDYWKYTEKGWVRISQQEFKALGDDFKEAVPDLYAVLGVKRNASSKELKQAYKTLVQKLHPNNGGDVELFTQLNDAWKVLGNPAKKAVYDARLAVSKNPIPDYYAVLGLNRNASAQELKRVHRNMVKKLHPDRKGDEELMKQLNEAWDTLGDPAKRAAYDAKLEGSITKLDDAIKRVAADLLPESPEGVSLAVTRNIGREVPAGFSPIADASGLGFNAANYGAVDFQLAKHLADTKQTGVLGARLMLTDPLIGGTMGNMIFFGGMMGTDLALSSPFQEWTQATSNKEQEALKKAYGDAFDPALMAKDEKKAEETLQALRQQGFNTVAPSTYEAVKAAELPSVAGTTITFPFLLGKQGLSKTFVGSQLGIKPLMDTDETRTLLAISAVRLKSNRMVRKYAEVKTQEDFNSFYKEVLSRLAESRASFTRSFDRNRTENNGVDLSADQKKVMAFFDSVQEEIESVARSSDSASQKSKKMSAIWQKSVEKSIKFSDDILVKIVAPQGKKALFQQLINENEATWESASVNLWTNLRAKSDPYIEKVQKITQRFAKKVKQIQKQRVGFSQQYEELKKALDTRNKELNAVYNSLPKTEELPEESMESTRALVMWNIDMSEAYARDKGLQADKFFQEWRQQIETLFNDNTYDQRTLNDVLKLINTGRATELQRMLDELAPKNDSTNGTMSSDELDELLPESSSEVSTGVH